MAGEPVDDYNGLTVPAEKLRKVWIWAILIALGGFLFGYDTGVISGALLFIRSDFDLNAFEQGSVVSVLLLGAMAGALGSGRIADRIGRRKVLALEGLIFVIGTVIAAFATGYWTLLLGRLVLGIAVGSASATVPVYLAEVAPTAQRGRMLTLNQLMITIGILVAYLVNVVFTSAEAWRAMIGVGVLPALAIIVAALWVLPESPEWQLSHNREDKARALISSISDDESADRFIAERERLNKENTETNKDEEHHRGWRMLLSPHVRPALIVGLTLAAVQQLGGINTIIYYAPTIIEKSGLSVSNAIYYSVAIGVINLLMTIVAINVVDRIGRRPLLMISLAGMAVMLVLLGISFASGWTPLLSLAFMVAYIAAFAAGMGPLFWTLIGEIFPPEAKATGSSASTAVNWTSNFALNLVFLIVINAIGQGLTFGIFAIVCGVGLWFTYQYVPETRDRDAAEVQDDLLTRFGQKTR